MTQPSKHLNVNRRAFIAASGALVVGYSAGLGKLKAAEAGAEVKPPLTPDELDSYLEISPDGTVTVLYGRIDGGQGLETAIAQMVAEELDVDYSRVQVVMSDTARTVNMGGASGALGVSRSGMYLRSCAAEARHLLVEEAAHVLDTSAQDLTVNDGVIQSQSDPGRSVSYADLIGGKYFSSKVNWNGGNGNGLLVSGEAMLKSPSEFKIIGTSIPREDLPLKTFAKNKTGYPNRIKSYRSSLCIRRAYNWTSSKR